MKYCVFCGHQIDKNKERCPYCLEDISEETIQKMYKSNITCIKCGSEKVNYRIQRKNKHRIVFEEQIYTCDECGKRFKDKDRLGKSFSNKSQIILSEVETKLITWMLSIIIVITIIAVRVYKKSEAEANWVKMECTGLPVMTFKQIKEGSPYEDEKYKGNSYIFTTTIEEIRNNQIVTPIEPGDYTGSYIKVNKEEIEKLKRYNVGDTITFCGTVKKISLYNKVYVENATIIY